MSRWLSLVEHQTHKFFMRIDSAKLNEKMNSGGRGFKPPNFFAKKFRVNPKRHVPADAAYNRARGARNIFAKQEPEEGSGKTLN